MPIAIDLSKAKNIPLQAPTLKNKDRKIKKNPDIIRTFFDQIATLHVQFVCQIVRSVELV